MDEGLVNDDASELVQVGLSKVAAQKAIAQTAFTRWVLPLGNFIVAPVLLMGLEKTPLFTIMPRIRLPVQVGATVLAFAATLPFAFALFHERGSIEVDDVEPEIRAACLEMGLGELTALHFDKGL